MARIIFSSVVDQITGKLNGSVFQGSYGGFQLRTKVVPRNPRSSKQQASRNNLATPAEAWRGLSDADRESWRSAATPTTKGFHLFVSSNKNIQLLTLPALSTYVDNPYPDAMTLELYDATWPHLIVSINGLAGNVPADTSILVAATRQKQPGCLFFSPSSYIPILEIEAGGSLSAPFELNAPYGSIITTLQSNMTVGIEISLISYINGLRSEKTRITTLVTAP